jgi:hypothetical protein
MNNVIAETIAFLFWYVVLYIVVSVFPRFDWFSDKPWEDGSMWDFIIPAILLVFCRLARIVTDYLDKKFKLKEEK